MAEQTVRESDQVGATSRGYAWSATLSKFVLTETRVVAHASHADADRFLAGGPLPTCGATRKVGKASEAVCTLGAGHGGDYHACGNSYRWRMDTGQVDG